MTITTRLSFIKALKKDKIKKKEQSYRLFLLKRGKND